MDIVKMLTLSTAHITKETAELFDAFEIPFDICIYDKESGFDHYGWFLTEWDLSQKADIPLDLLACFQLAESRSCDWLCLDHDGQITELLPTYEWE